MSKKILSFKITFIILFVFLGNGLITAQSKVYSKKDIENIIDESVDNLEKNDFHKSLILAKKALDLSIKKKDNSLIGECYNTIGCNFDILILKDKALFYFQKGLRYANKTDDAALKSLLYNNIADIYTYKKKSKDLEIQYFKKSLYYSELIKDSVTIYFRKLNLCWSYFNYNAYEQGKPYLDFINNNPKFSRDITNVALNMLNGMYYAHTNENKKAENYYIKAVSIGEKSYEKADLLHTYKNYSDFLARNGKFQNAYTLMYKYNTLYQDILDGDNAQKGKITGLNLEINEYFNEIKRIESEYKEKQIQLVEDKEKTQRNLFGIAGLFAISIIIFYFYIQNSRLLQKNRLNKLRHTIQQNIINATLTGQEVERKKIASFLHDNISSLLSSAALHLTVFANNHDLEGDEIKKSVSLLTEAHNKVRDLSHELIPALLVRFGLIHALEDLCEKFTNSTIRFEFTSEIENTKRFSDELELTLYFIVSELFNNIIKHSKANLAQIAIFENENRLHLKVIDNGRGFVRSPFDLQEGYGILQIRARINAIKGQIQIDSKLDLGTIITIELPISF